MKKFAIQALASVLLGLGAGLASGFFLIGLHDITEIRLSHPEFIWFLPLFGLLSVYVYSNFGKNSHLGNDLILEEIHSPQEKIPFRMLPFILFATWGTHLFGGSAGREGTGVQMGGVVASRVASLFKRFAVSSQTILMCGLSAGFSSVFGTPLAGAIFGMEVLQIGTLPSQRFVFCLISSLVAKLCVDFMGYQHSHFAGFSFETNSLKEIPILLLLGLVFGIVARFFVLAMHHFQPTARKIFKSPYLVVLISSVLIALSVHVFSFYKYVGIGDEGIRSALQGTAEFKDWILKFVYTVVTLGSGFKGGEVTPLFFVGSNLGAVMGNILHVDAAACARLGFLAVFAAASNTPIACTLLGVELFGAPILVPAAIVNVVAYLLSGSHSLYHSQRNIQEKHKF